MARGPCLTRAQRRNRRRPSYSSTQTPAIFDSLKSRWRSKIRRPEIEVGEVSETEDGDLVIETGVTLMLTLALTLPQGLEKIREAVEELKLNPPSTCTGIHSQLESSAVYPLFFMGKDVENPSYKSLYVNEIRGVFGIGAAVAIQAVRKKVGYRIQVRADANRNWTYEEAIQFGSSVKDCDLQYLEEPVKNEGDIIRFCEESGLLVALDETIDSIREHPLDKLVKYTHPGMVATVIKPSVVVGFENAAIVAQWA